MNKNELLKLANNWMNDNNIPQLVKGDPINTNKGKSIDRLELMTQYAKTIFFRIGGFTLIMLIISILIVEGFNLNKSVAYLTFMGPVMIYICFFAINQSKISLYKTYNQVG
jgi:hypothetical protein